jgi:hypothetical protein
MVGMYQYVNTMIRGYPYRVVHIFRRNHDIFVYLTYNYINEFRLIYVQDDVDGEPVLHAYGSGGFSTYM